MKITVQAIKKAILLFNKENLGEIISIRFLEEIRFDSRIEDLTVRIEYLDENGFSIDGTDVFDVKFRVYSDGYVTAYRSIV
ncbi:MAG: hypothetical protein K2L70_04465 [Clostridia bacterium]|nr:hypothetical protein [Clostridia bacterium]